MKNLRSVLLTCLLSVGFGLSPGSHAAILTVTSLADDGSAGTLRSQVAAAAAGDTIDFNVTGTITLTGFTGIAITQNLTITGPGAGSLNVVGNNYASVFTVSGGVVGISGLKLSNGSGTTITYQEANRSVGGAMYVSAGTVTVAGCTFSGNRADFGGGIFQGGGSLTVTGSTFSGNDLGNYGWGGGIYVDTGTLAVTNSTFSGNTASRGGAIYNAGTATVMNSTISDNTAKVYIYEEPGQPGVYNFLYGWGGGIFNGGPLTLTNCTVSGNDAEGYGNSSNIGGGGIWTTVPLTVSNSTVTGNSAQRGGGILSVGTTVTLSNSIVSDSPLGGDLFGPVSGNYNLVEGGGITGSNNITGQDPMLGPLANNGGPTKTHLLLAGSPATAAGDPNFDATNTPYDQRGTGYPRVRNGRLCMGAFESEVSQSGTSFIVNSLEDHDDSVAGPTDCTLREAVKYAPTGATITFSVAGTIVLTGGELVIAKNLTITGPASGITVSGNNATRIFTVNSGTLALSTLTLSGGNGVSASNVGPGIGGAIYVTTGTVAVTGCTFSGNSSTSNGGAIRSQGGCTLTVTNSTFSGNTATTTAGAIRSGGTLSIMNSTVSGNSSATGGGIFINGGEVTLSNSIVAGNSATTAAPDISGTITAGDYNLVGVTTGATIPGANTLTGAANLGTLANNGGPTKTFALLVGSPAIDAGSNALIPGGVTTDQRGFARIQSGTVDIGALEVDATPPSVTINQAAAQTDPTISTPIHFTVVFTESVSGFTTGDVTLSGTAGAATATVTGSGPTYGVVVSGMTQTGTVIATIAAGVALDASSNGNTISTTTDNTISYSSAETVQSSGTVRAVEGGGFEVGFIGNPAQVYLIQFSLDLAPGSWQTLTTQAANTAGLITIIDNPPAGTAKRFYRMLLP